MAQTAAAGGAPGIVRADETELNSVLKEYVKDVIDKRPADSPAVVRDMKMNLTDDRLRLYVLVNFRGKDLTLVMEGRVEQMAATPEAQELMRLPRNLRDLRVENGKLVVVFR